MAPVCQQTPVTCVGSLEEAVVVAELTQSPSACSSASSAPQTTSEKQMKTQKCAGCRPRCPLLLLLCAFIGLGVLGSVWVSLTTHSQGATPRRVDVLLIVHDAGETLALAGPAQRLLDRGADVLVLPMGQPATDRILCQGLYSCQDPLPSITLNELGVQVDILDGPMGRHQLLSDKALELVTQQIQARLVVTGSNYAMQRQLGHALRKAGETFGAKFVNYYDSLRIMGSDDDVDSDIQLSFVQDADETWVASPLVQPSAETWGGKYVVVGQPTLEDWEETSLDSAQVYNTRRALYGDAAAEQGTPALCWFGGYGPGYEQALRAWCQTVKILHEAGRDWRFSLSSHPGHGYGQLDRWVLKQEGVNDIVTIAPGNLSGKVLALASNLTVSQGNTGCAQSIFAGKPALYLDPAEASENEQALGVLLGVIPNVISAADAAVAAEQAAAAGWAVDAPTVRQKAKVPADGTSAIIDNIQRLSR